MNIPQEYRSLPEFPGYHISEDGVVYSSKQGCLKQMTKTLSAGRHFVSLQSSCGEKYMSVSRLVAMAFHENPENKPQVAHGDGNPLNNHKSNLRWATAQENVDDSKTHGTWTRGEKHGKAILTEAIVRDVRANFNKNSCTIAMLASKHGVSWGSVYYVLKGITWRHVK